MSPRPKKQTQPAHLPEAIQETAWKQIARLGASAINLRGIARELGITAPAIYNYFPDRNALVTALIIQAYTTFGDSQLAARDAISPGEHARRLRAIGLAYRDWALAYPQRYQLIFGAPIPGYQSPIAQVLPAAARSLSALVSVIDDLRLAGKLNTADFPEVHSDHRHNFENWKTFGGNYDLHSLSVAVLIWARVHGIVSLEISGELPPFGLEGDALYHYEIQSIERQFILP